MFEFNVINDFAPIALYFEKLDWTVFYFEDASTTSIPISKEVEVLKNNKTGGISGFKLWGDQRHLATKFNMDQDKV